VQLRCVSKPSKALEVSTFVLLSRLTNCTFAVKGSGHAAFGGASSIDGGITVTIGSFKQVSPSGDRKTVNIGPGNRWVDVYLHLTHTTLVLQEVEWLPSAFQDLSLEVVSSFFC
jgi:FAD/FMN-containing dehydrogenase